MHLPRTLGCLALALLAACGHSPPYVRGRAPSADTLLAATEPRVDAVAVPDATIVLNRMARADLAMLAQAPGRFRASVSKSGNELISLAFHEEGYSMRYKLDQLPTGFYAGPPSPCAVETMLGIPLSYRGLVALVLGGAPMLEGRRITDQRWDRKLGVEVLTLADERFEQELRFERASDRWRFVGTSMWARADAEHSAPLWTLRHDYPDDGNTPLPERTRIKAPGEPRDVVVIIHYHRRDLNPSWARTPNDANERATSSSTAPDETPATDEWDDDEGWDDGAWDDERSGNEAAPTQEPPKPPEELPSVRMNPSGRPAVAGAASPTTSIPSVFRLDAAGLPIRGDVCRR